MDIREFIRGLASTFDVSVLSKRHASESYRERHNLITSRCNPLKQENSGRNTGRYFNQYDFYQQRRQAVENRMNPRFLIATDEDMIRVMESAGEWAESAKPGLDVTVVELF